MQPGDVDEEALDWVVRVADPGFEDWDGYTAWLEADASHASRYDATALAIARIDEIAATLPATTPATTARAFEPAAERPSSRWRTSWMGAALAATIVGGVGIGVWNDRARPYAVETAAGSRREVPLSDGSVIAIAGGSRLVLDRADPRRARLERGEALFRVRHDDARPFLVEVDDLDVVDLGTVFEVRRAASSTEISVAEGSVMVDPDGAAVRLGPGQAASIGGGIIERRTVDVADIGEWTEGRLAFDGTPLGEVAADLSRHLGRPVEAAPGVAARGFRGTLETDGLRTNAAMLGELLGVRVRDDRGVWILEARP